MSATIFPHPSLLSAAMPPDRWPVGRVFGEEPFRTDNEVLAVTFSPAGLWSVEDGGSLRQWDPTSGRQLTLHSLEEDATLWSFDPSGQLLAGASVDLTLWELASGRRRAVIPQNTWITALAFAPGSDLAATGHDDGVIRLWDTADGQLIRQLRGYLRPVSALAFGPDGKRLVSAGEDKLMFVWNLETGEIEGLFGGHTDRIPALVWHPDGRRLISAGWDTTARIWDADTHEPIILLNSHASQVVALALSGDGELLACADSANAVHVWDLKTSEALRIFHDAEAEVRCLAFNTDATRLAAGGADCSLHVWEPRQGIRWGARAGLLSNPKSEIRNPKSEISQAEVASDSIGRPWDFGFRISDLASVAISPDSKQLASVHGASLRIWSTDSGELILDQPNDTELRAVAYSPDGRLLATGGNRVELRDAATGKRHHLLEGPEPPVVAVAFALAAPLVAAGSGSSADVWLWDARTGEPALLIPDAIPGCVVQAIAFHPGRHVLAVAGWDWFEAGDSDGAVVLWDVTTRRREALLGGGAAAIAFHPAGRRLAVAGLDRTLRVWDLAERALVGEWPGHADAVRCLAFSPDGRWLASGGDDRTVRLWDAETGRPHLIASLAAQVTSLAFAPDGRFPVTGNRNGSSSQLLLSTALDATGV
jgi:WD40 repeat protein